MDDQNALKQTNAAIDLIGGTSATARALGVPHWNVSKWRKQGVAARHAAKLAQLANMPAHELRPDVFPPE